MSRLPSVGGTSVLVRIHHHLIQHQHLMQRHFPGVQIVSILSSRGCIKLLVRVVRVVRVSCQLNLVLVMLPINCDRNTHTQHTHTLNKHTQQLHTRQRQGTKETQRCTRKPHKYKSTLKTDSGAKHPLLMECRCA